MTSLTPEILWLALTDEEQVCGCMTLLSSREKILSEPRRAIFEQLSRQKSFRPRFFYQRKPEDNLRMVLTELRSGSLSNHRESVIKAWLLERHRSLLTRFLDAAGIPHENGLVGRQASNPGPNEFAAAIRAVHPVSDSRVLAVYLGYLLLYGGEFWHSLEEAMSKVEIDAVETIRRHVRKPDLPVSHPANPEESKTAQVVQKNQLPSSDEFTTLDNMLIRTAVASAFGEFGALTSEALEDLVEEIIELNSQRQHSLFHRGFLHAIQSRELVFHFPGENEERRSWYFTGVILGLLRANRRPQVVELLRSQADLAFEVSSNRKRRCGAMLLPHVYQALRIAGEYAAALRWLESQLERLPPHQQFALVDQATEESASHIRRGQWAEAEGLLSFLERHVSTCIPERFHPRFLPAIQRRKAQVLQLKGDFDNAQSLLSQLAENRSLDERGSILCDLALVTARLKSLSMVLPSQDQAAANTTSAALRTVRGQLQAAVAEQPDASANAHFCLGVLELLSNEDSSRTAEHFKASLAGMHRKEEAYTESELLPWARFLLGIALMETAEPANLSHARELVEQSAQSTVSFPLWLWSRALRAAALFDDLGVGTSIAEHLRSKRGSEAWESIWTSGLIRDVPSLRNLYLQWLEDAEVSIGIKWTRTRELLPMLLRDFNQEGAQRALDIMESIADQDPGYADAFQEHLKSDSNYSPAWTPDEARDTRLRLLESMGRLDEVAALVERRFHRICQLGNPRWTAEAEELLNWLSLLGRTHEHIQLLRARLLIAPERLEESPWRQERNVRVLYIGGNETQMAYEPWLRTELQRRYPGLHLTFYFPEWSSKWNLHLQRVRPKISSSHAVVLNSLVRTQFGRHVRALCNSEHPWFPCSGRGRDSLLRSIEAAALWAAARPYPPGEVP